MKDVETKIHIPRIGSFHPAFILSILSILSKWIFRISILKLKFKFRLAPERIHQVSGER